MIRAIGLVEGHPLTRLLSAASTYAWALGCLIALGIGVAAFLGRSSAVSHAASIEAAQAEARAGRSVILVATFDGSTDEALFPHRQVRRAVGSVLDSLALDSSVIVLGVDQVFAPEDTLAARDLMERAGASVMLWGESAGAQVTLSVLSAGASEVRAIATQFMPPPPEAGGSWEYQMTQFVVSDIAGAARFFALYAVSLALSEDGQRERAVEVAGAAIASTARAEVAPWKTDALLLRCRLLRRAEADAVAVADCRDAVTLSPRRSETHVELAYSMIGLMERVEGAYPDSLLSTMRYHLDRAVELAPDWPRARFDRAVFVDHVEGADYAPLLHGVALSDYRRLVALVAWQGLSGSGVDSLDLAHTHFMLSGYHAARGETREAIEAAQRTVTYAPEKTEGWIATSLFLRKLGYFASSRRHAWQGIQVARRRLLRYGPLALRTDTTVQAQPYVVRESYMAAEAEYRLMLIVAGCLVAENKMAEALDVLSDMEGISYVTAGIYPGSDLIYLKAQALAFSDRPQESVDYLSAKIDRYGPIQSLHLVRANVYLYRQADTLRALEDLDIAAASPLAFQEDYGSVASHLTPGTNPDGAFARWLGSTPRQIRARAEALRAEWSGGDAPAVRATTRGGRGG